MNKNNRNNGLHSIQLTWVDKFATGFAERTVPVMSLLLKLSEGGELQTSLLSCFACVLSSYLPLSATTILYMLLAQCYYYVLPSNVSRSRSNICFSVIIFRLIQLPYCYPPRNFGIFADEWRSGHIRVSFYH